MNRVRALFPVAVVLFPLVAGCAGGAGIVDPAGGLEGLRHSSRAYMAAWLSNDPEAVMATFVAEPVLSPSGLPFIEGAEGARAFWWPAGSAPARVARFDYQELEVSGSGDMGLVRGTYTLVFEYEGETFTNRGKYLHILRRVTGDRWRISHHLWNDLPSEDGQ